MSLHSPLPDVLGTPLTVVDTGLEAGGTAVGVDGDGPAFGVTTADDSSVAVGVGREVELSRVDALGGVAGLAVGAAALGVLSAGSAGLLAEDTPEAVSQGHERTDGRR